MSRHLRVLPVLRSTSAKLRQPAAGKENAEVNTERKRSRRKLEKKEEMVQNCGEIYLNLKKIDEIETEGSCETPKSDMNRIPIALDCPPAPKKPIRRIGCVSCKRKLMPELEFFEVDRRKEVDEFFRSSYERISDSNAKRKCSAAATTSADVLIVGTSTTGRAVSTESSSSSSPVRIIYTSNCGE